MIVDTFTKIPGVRSLWRKFPIGSVEARMRYDIWTRPHYAYGVYASATLAKRLGLPGISVMEFGVAGGRGLLALEAIADEIGKHIGIEIYVLGFDAGSGMPKAEGYKDLPYVWEEGFYQMDQAALKAKLKKAELIIGDVAETIPKWLSRENNLPVGFAALDLDYYSSTKAAFALFEPAGSAMHMPRVYCYLDDIIYPEYACHNEYSGELCAIREFNEEHEDSKICPLHLLRNTRVQPAPWNDQIYVYHDFKHPLYCNNITPSGAQFTQKPL
jgi:hypothetical protein